MKLSPEQVVATLDVVTEKLSEDKYPYLVVALVNVKREIEGLGKTEMVETNARAFISSGGNPIDIMTLFITLWKRFPDEMSVAFFQSKTADSRRIRVNEELEDL